LVAVLRGKKESIGERMQRHRLAFLLLTTDSQIAHPGAYGVHPAHDTQAKHYPASELLPA